MVDSFEVDRFNDVSSRAQQATGVDPAMCFSMREIDGSAEDKTPIPIYLGHIAAGVYPLVREEGRWRTHDIVDHSGRVRSLHPATRPIIEEAAIAGLDAHIQGNTQLAEALTFAVDDYMCNRQGLWANALYRMLLLLDKVTSPEGNTSFRIELDRVQTTHARAIAAALEELQPKVYS